MLLLSDDLLPPATLPNRGLAFGDGFFETLTVENGRLRLAADHLARMRAATAALHLVLPAPLATARVLAATLARLAAACRLPAARLRLQLWRALRPPYPGRRVAGHRRGIRGRRVGH